MILVMSVAMHYAAEAANSSPFVFASALGIWR
jgi:hypothetical protein